VRRASGCTHLISTKRFQPRETDDYSSNNNIIIILACLANNSELIIRWGCPLAGNYAGVNLALIDLPNGDRRGTTAGCSLMSMPRTYKYCENPNGSWLLNRLMDVIGRAREIESVNNSDIVYYWLLIFYKSSISYTLIYGILFFCYTEKSYFILFFYNPMRVTVKY